MTERISYSYQSWVRVVGKHFMDRNGKWVRADKVFLLPEDPPAGPGENDALISCLGDMDNSDKYQGDEKSCSYCFCDLAHTQALHRNETILKHSDADRI